MRCIINVSGMHRYKRHRRMYCYSGAEQLEPNGNCFKMLGCISLYILYRGMAFKVHKFHEVYMDQYIASICLHSNFNKKQTIKPYTSVIYMNLLQNYFLTFFPI